MLNTATAITNVARPSVIIKGNIVQYGNADTHCLWVECADHRQALVVSNEINRQRTSLARTPEMVDMSKIERASLQITWHLSEPVPF